MAKPVRYKRPSKINPVTIGLALFVSTAAYLTYQYLPLYLTQQEALRILDETSSKFSGQSSRYLHVTSAMRKLERDLVNGMRRIGIQDPEMETWIEPAGENEVAFGVLYSNFVEWPYDVVEKTEFVSEIEMLCTRPSPGQYWTCAKRKN